MIYFLLATYGLVSLIACLAYVIKFINPHLTTDSVFSKRPLGMVILYGAFLSFDLYIELWVLKHGHTAFSVIHLNLLINSMWISNWAEGRWKWLKKRWLGKVFVSCR